MNETSEIIPGETAGEKRETLVTEMLRVTEELADVVARETELLVGGRWLEMHKINPEKTRLALRYGSLAPVLRDVPREALDRDSEIGDLRVAAARLDAVMNESARRLKTHMAANRRIAELVANAARDAATPSVAYGNGRAPMRARYGQQSPAVAVVKVL